MNVNSRTMSAGPRRAGWMTARARNAAKRVGVVSIVGLLAVAGTLLVLVLVPAQVDRAVRARIAALPPLADTLPLHIRLDSARLREQDAERLLQTLRIADADRIANAASSSRAAGASPVTVDFQGDSDARRDLGVRIARARSAPLVESYRALGEAELLSADARVRGLLDSLNDVNRDREAYAALGGPDARYAALTARLSTLGQRLLVIAEQRLASTAPASSPAAVGAPATAATAGTTTDATTGATAATGATADSTVAILDTTTLAPASRFSIDSVPERNARALLDSAAAQVLAVEAALKAVRAANADLAAKRTREESETTVKVPPVAMLFAALALGLALGYGVAFTLEVRRPRVADVAEVERVTQARVIVHAGASRAALNRRGRRQGDEALASVIDTASDAFQLLHVTLTGFGDTTREVRVLADSPLLSAAVGINLAAAAARDARTTLLIDADPHVGLVGRLLHREQQAGVAEALVAPATAPALVVRTNVGRDQHVDTLFAGGRNVEPVPENLPMLQHQLQLLAREHDLTVVLAPVGGAGSSALVLPATDAILCARLGATRLDWLLRAVIHLRANNVRLRAVFLWAARAPSVK